MEPKKENIIIDKTFNFSLDIISLFKELQNEREYILSKQLLRSATSIGANVEEASAAQSKKDFINKMSIASKEARETKYWLKLLDKSDLTQHNISPFFDGNRTYNKHFDQNNNYNSNQFEEK